MVKVTFDISRVSAPTKWFKTLFIRSLLKYWSRCKHKMPEVSQDLFEVKNPVQALVTPEVLRARANSAGNRYQASFQELVRAPTSRTKRLSSCVSEHDIESFTEGMTLLDHNWIDEREISHRFVIINFYNKSGISRAHFIRFFAG